jgi:hypothetical protein
MAGKQEEVIPEVREESDGSASVALDELEPGKPQPRKPAADAPTEGEGTTPSGEDDGAAGDEDDDTPPHDGDAHDDELAQASTDRDREAIRARRRDERADRKRKAKEREERLQNELVQERRARQSLEERMGLIERRNVGAELAQLDGAIKQAGDYASHYQRIIAEAVKAGNGELVADATRKLSQAERRAEELTNVRRAYTTQTAAPTPTQVDPVVQANASAWLSRHTWYDPAGRDQDSAVALTVDRALAAEGRDPRDPTYWTELDKRLSKYLPHRVKGDIVTPATPTAERLRKTPVTGSGRESAGNSGDSREYKVSAERVKALKDAGMWDDPKSRADGIRRYREYDRQVAARKE